MGLDGAGRADAHDVLHPVGAEQLPGINADGGHAHAGGHDGDLDALIGAGVALDPPDVVYQHGVFQKMIGDILGTKGIAGHQDRLAEIGGHGLDMGCRVVHFRSPFIEATGIRKTSLRIPIACSTIA